LSIHTYLIAVLTYFGNYEIQRAALHAFGLTVVLNVLKVVILAISIYLPVLLERSGMMSLGDMN
jgi:hypothetical protein